MPELATPHYCYACGEERPTLQVRRENGIHLQYCRYCAQSNASRCISCNVRWSRAQTVLVPNPSDPLGNRVRQCRECYNRLNPRCTHCGGGFTGAAETVGSRTGLCRICASSFRDRLVRCHGCGNRDEYALRDAARNAAGERVGVCPSCYNGAAAKLQSGDGRTFGVEVEFLAPSAPCNTALWRFGRVKTDGSIMLCKRERDASGNYPLWDPTKREGEGRELASHPMSGKAGGQAILAMFAELRSLGVWVNPSCGLHVHIGARDLTPAQVKNLMAWWVVYEPIMFGCVEKHRRGNYYCASAKSKQNNGWEQDRYRAMNLVARSAHGTLEFRLHHATMDPKELLSWVRILLRFVDGMKDRPAFRATEIPAGPRHKVVRLFRDLRLPMTLRKHVVRQIRRFNPRATMVRDTMKIVRAEWRNAEQRNAEQRKGA